MIVECESCLSKFNLDESLIKDEGLKVRCSKCKHIFTVYPPQQEEMDEQIGEQDLDQDMDEELEETVALDSPPIFDQEEEELPPSDEMEAADFDQAFQEAIEEERLEETAVDEPSLEEAIDQGKDFEHAEEIEEESDRKDIKGEEKRGEEEAVSIPEEKKKSRLSKYLFVVLLVIFLLIIVCGIIYFFLPNYLPDFLSSQKPVPVETLTDKGVKQLTFKEVSGSFVQSDVAGRRFVVRGRILNNYPEARHYILVKAEILDEKGQVIRRKLAYTGNVFTENEVKNLPMDEIDKILKNRLGRNKMNINVMPNTDVPFMVVFENLPQNLSEFSVEAVSSAPSQ
jgi:predicted Zn finger-like uncharacterized protein